LDYLSHICNLAAVFAGFTAIVSVLRSDDETGADEITLNKIRLRQMLEICLFTIGAGLMPQLIVSFDTTFDLALQVSGALAAASGSLLLILQGHRAFPMNIRKLAGYSVRFTRFAISLGAIVVALFAIAAFGIRPAAAYSSAVTLGLVIAGLQFLRTSTSVLRVPSTAKERS
jgi:hypothetical protein